MLDAKTALRRLAEYAYARLERERPRVIAQRSHRGKERTLRVLRPAQLLDSEAVPQRDRRLAREEVEEPGIFL